MKAQTQNTENYPFQDETFTWEDEPEPNYEGDLFETISNLVIQQNKDMYGIDLNKNISNQK